MLDIPAKSNNAPIENVIFVTAVNTTRNIIILVLFVFSTKVGNAQELSPADARKRKAISEQLGLLPVQEQLLDSLFVSCAREFALLDEQIKAAERNPELTEEDVVLRMNVITQERSDLRAVRELDIQAILTPPQRAVYEERIQPAKPNVLHFGIHNRMDCNICVE